jgi:hypothetical protein
MTESLPDLRVAVNAGLMQAWLALAAAECPDDGAGPPAGQLPAIGYGWWPDLLCAPADAEELVRLAGAAGIFTCPAGVTLALQHYDGPGGRTYRVLVTIPGPGGGQLTLASRRKPWREIGSPGTCGPDAAAHILTEVAGTASQMLAFLACCLSQPAAMPAPAAFGR